MHKITTLLLATSLIGSLFAKEITLSTKEIANWDIKTKKLQTTSQVPLGSYIVEVRTPPTLLHSISLPFDAQVLSLNVASYQKVKEGDLLAVVTGPEWISIQKDTIADAIELRHHQHLAARKNRLCKEEIIPQKECTAANAELRTDKITLEASKALLKSFGASKSIITKLLSTLEIKPELPIYAIKAGTITTLHAQPGQTTDASKALFVMQSDGALWIESNLPLNAALSLQKDEEIALEIKGKSYKAKVLQLAPTIDTQTQSRHVRFGMQDRTSLLAGMRSEATIIAAKKAVKVPKKSLIKSEGKTILFVKESGYYKDIVVEVLAEDEKYYYLKDQEALHLPVVITAVAALKTLLGEDDE